ncbi:hypothetical protein SK128_010157 [Halocaridina rubra]|uniref:TELO2-interacting protein 2 n=1 Tax=Halocaridina rubra TaxID=373956 RepID=A0AAN8XCD1_HALRR
MDLETEGKVLDLLERLKLEQINEDEITSVCAKLVQACYVPRLGYVEDTPYTADDFIGIADKAEVHLYSIYKILEALCSAKSKEQNFSCLFMKYIVVTCLHVASEYTDSNLEWSCERAAAAANNVVNKVCELANCQNVSDLFSIYCSQTLDVGEVAVNYLEHILQNLVKTLNKANWKACPASKATYFFILMNLDEKCLGSNMPYLLPPALFIVDDWEARNKVFGLKCLQHIVENTPGSELRWYGRAAVIFDALKPLLHSRETEILEALYPAIIPTAAVLEADPAVTGYLRSISNYDEIMQPLILNMRYEQKLTLRAVYSSTLPLILRAMGILAVKWSEEFIPMCEDYLATYTGPAANDRLNILKSLQIFIQECWPQVHRNVFCILKMILRLIYDITDKNSDLKSEVTEGLKRESLKVITLLYDAAPKTTEELLMEVGSAEVHPECRAFLKEIENIRSVQV